jgi:uncharacterized protein (TIGR01777 family)
MYVEMSKDPQRVVEAADKIVISGASGMLGAALVSRLAAQSTPVVQLVRRPARADDEMRWNPKADPPVADPPSLEGIGGAIHLSGASVAGRRWSKKYKRELVASRVESTQAIAKLLAGLRRPPRTLVVASAVGIYGSRGDELLDESSAPGTGFLADLCRKWEAAAQPARDAGIRVVHTRFGVVLGQGTGALSKMLPIFRLGLGGRLGSGRQWISWVSLDDVVGAIRFALENSSVSGPVNVVSPHPVKNAEFTRVLARELHKPAMFPAPASALRFFLGQIADEALLSSAAVHPRKLLSAGFEFAHPTLPEALEAALG